MLDLNKILDYAYPIYIEYQYKKVTEEFNFFIACEKFTHIWELKSLGLIPQKDFFIKEHTDEGVHIVVFQTRKETYEERIARINKENDYMMRYTLHHRRRIRIELRKENEQANQNRIETKEA